MINFNNYSICSIILSDMIDCSVIRKLKEWKSNDSNFLCY